MTTTETLPKIQRIGTLDEVLDGYDAVFSDVWGVIHDGKRKSAAAEAALLRAREAGRAVVLLTNSPRPRSGVQSFLRALDIADGCYDHIVTSGDVTRALIREVSPRILHIGPQRDLDIFEGLDVSRVGEAEAEAVVATGLYDDEFDSPEDYADLLARLAGRGLPMICANPDLVVHRGPRLIWCAGALARDYASLGGEVRLAGKPFKPIYDVATGLLGAVDRRRIIAIGDGLLTDIKGANDYGLDALLILRGIHADALGEDPVTVVGELSKESLTARYMMPALE